MAVWRGCFWKYSVCAGIVWFCNFTIFFRTKLLHLHVLHPKRDIHSHSQYFAWNWDKIGFYINKRGGNLWSNQMKHYTVYYFLFAFRCSSLSAVSIVCWDASFQKRIPTNACNTKWKWKIHLTVNTLQRGRGIPSR